MLDSHTEESVDSVLKIDDDKLCINNLVIIDTDIVQYFKDLSEESRQKQFETALKVGVISLKTIGISEKIDYIQKEFIALNSQFKLNIEKFGSDIDKQLRDAFGDKGTVSTIIANHFGENGVIVKKIFDPNTKDSPLNTLMINIREDINKLRTDLQLSEQKEEIEEKTPLKGYKFEDICEKILSDIAHNYDDIFERTTDTVGKITKSKAGDYVITTGGNLQRRIVFEAKDREIKSEPQIKRELNDAMENRDACYGVLIGKYVESLPRSVSWFKEYPNNQLAICLSSKEFNEEIREELLLIAYKWARAKALAGIIHSKEVDFNKIIDKLNVVKGKINELSQIKTQCTNIETASTNIRQQITVFEKAISAELDSLLDVIEKEENKIE